MESQSREEESSEIAHAKGAVAAEELSRSARVGLFAGPVVALVVGVSLSLLPASDLRTPARLLVAMTLWMAIWWMTEAVPLGVTSMLPLVMFPVMGILDTDEVASRYSVSVSWLFFGGFQLAFAVERTGLHRRLAFGVMRAMGARPHLLMLGVMLSVALLSMFLSNTSTTLMVLPVAEAMTASLTAGDATPESASLGKALMLGLAYSASIGGMGTIIGTPVNGVLAAQAELFGLRVTFSRWTAFALPLALLMLCLTWLYLVLVFGVPRSALPASHPTQLALQKKFGRMSQAERRVAAVFGLTVLAWMCRKPLVDALHLGKHRLEDSTIAIAATVLLFVIPARDQEGRSARLMDWPALLRTPWHILFLFGGGIALAGGFDETGLSEWIGDQLGVLRGLPPPLVAFLVVLTVTFLTEVMSNTATANVLLPIMGQLARSLGMRPAELMVPATLAASCAFMLPVATAPNAIVIATRRVEMRDMARTGLLINLASAALITAWASTWGRLWFDMSPLAPGAAPEARLANATLPHSSPNTP